jgi:hypothetical protein
MASTWVTRPVACRKGLTRVTAVIVGVLFLHVQICAQLGAKYLKENGLLVLTGAQAAMNGT